MEGKSTNMDQYQTYNEHLTRKDIAHNFAISIEKERIRQKLTQAEMAEKLDLSPSAYKRILTGETDKIEVYTTYKAYILTSRLAYEFVGYGDNLVNNISKMKHLTDEELDIISSMLDYMIQKKGN